jgi:sec-independent protein translocase protein TatA
VGLVSTADPRHAWGEEEDVMRPGLWEILAIVAVALLLFGAGRLADIGKGLGEGIRNFKKGLKDDGEDDPDQLPEATGDDEDAADAEEVAAKVRSAKKE